MSTESNVQLRTAPRFHKSWMLTGTPSDFLDSLISEFGDFIHYKGFVNFYLINDPELVRQVLKETHRRYDKSTVIYDRFRNALGNSLVNAEGDHWRRQRKLIQPAFNPASIQKFFQIMVDSSTQMTHRWSQFAKDGQSFNLADEMNVLTLEIAGKSLFSDGFNGAATTIRQWTKVINQYSAKPPIPILSNPRLPTPLNLKLKHTLKSYGVFINNMIDARLKQPDQNDLLSIFLGMRDEDTGEPMKDSEIAEEVLGMIIGGHETASTALTWIFYELDKHPDIERRVVEEVQQVTAGNELQYAQVPELKYTKCVIEEAMRLHPPLWFENRNTMESVELGGSKIPKGKMIILSRYALHRNPRVWNDPTRFDPDRFNPDNPNSMSDAKAAGAYIPFSSGPRVCIGRHFAMMEMTVILCIILQKFKVRVSPKHKHAIATNLTMEPKNGLRIQLEARINHS